MITLALCYVFTGNMWPINETKIDTFFIAKLVDGLH